MVVDGFRSFNVLVTTVSNNGWLFKPPTLTRFAVHAGVFTW